MNNDSSKLQRGLKNRHIQLIAMGGAIGTGLFLGSAQVIQSAGPSIILGYAIGGLIAFLIMRQLGEMIVEDPLLLPYIQGEELLVKFGAVFFVLIVTGIIKIWKKRDA